MWTAAHGHSKTQARVREMWRCQFIESTAVLRLWHGIPHFNEGLGGASRRGHRSHNSPSSLEIKLIGVLNDCANRRLTKSPTANDRGHCLAQGRWHRRLERRRDQARHHAGRRKDGRRLLPPMGFAWYARMSQQDLDAIVAYLRTVPPKE